MAAARPRPATGGWRSPRSLFPPPQSSTCVVAAVAAVAAKPIKFWLLKGPKNIMVFAATPATPLGAPPPVAPRPPTCLLLWLCKAPLPGIPAERDIASGCDGGPPRRNGGRRQRPARDLLPGVDYARCGLGQPGGACGRRPRPATGGGMAQAPSPQIPAPPWQLLQQWQQNLLNFGC